MVERFKSSGMERGLHHVERLLKGASCWFL